MRAVIYVPFVLSGVFVALRRWVCRRSSPRPAAWSLTIAMVLLAGSTLAALSLLAWPLLARLPAVARVGGWQARAVENGVPVPELVSVLAALIITGIAALVVVEVRRSDRARRDLLTIHAGLASPSAGAVTVVDDTRPLAYALPRTLAHGARIVVSTGMLATLDVDERVALLAHEQSHLTHGHRLFAVVAGLAAALNPLLRSGREDLGFALERWADEDAATTTGRVVTARALAKAALARLATMDRGADRWALEFVRLGVPQRVEALLDPGDRPRRAGLAWLLAVVALAGIVAVVWATRDTERLFELLQRR